MNDLVSKLQKEYGNSFSYGVLPFLQFPAKEEMYKILVIGAEHGDKVSGTNAMLYVADKLRLKQPAHTSVDMVPVLDTEGYPGTRTSIGCTLGNKKYLDSAYLETDKPVQVSSLLNLLDSKKYNLALLLTEAFAEEAPSLNGYFMFYQLTTLQSEDDGTNRLKFLFPEAKDVGGSLANKLMQENVHLLNPKDGDLGDGHIVTSPGVVFQGFVEEGNLVFRTRNQFAFACQERNIPALVLVAPSSYMNNKCATGSHIVALEEAIRFYESISQRLERP